MAGKAPKGFDLDAAAAEALGEPFRFTWRGAAYEMPNDMPIDVIRHLEAEDHIETIRAAVGVEAWDSMPVPPGMRAAALLIDAWMGHLGIGRGKSSGSTDSSESTESE